MRDTDPGGLDAWTAICLLAYIYLAIAAAAQRRLEPRLELAGLIPITAPELLRLLLGVDSTLSDRESH
jgi:hypothetical protein